MQPDDGQSQVADYRSRWRAYKIIVFMRWVTLVLGPISLGWDRFLFPLLHPIMEKIGIPEIILMEDLMRWFVIEIIPVTPAMREMFLAALPHIPLVCTGLFVLFVVWSIIAKQKTRKAARDIAIGEQLGYPEGFE